MDLSFLDETPLDDKTYKKIYNPSKYLLWQDVLLGLFDKSIEGLNMPAHYKEAEKRMERNVKAYPEWEFLFKMQKELSSALVIKSEIGLKIKESYDKKDKKALDEIARIQLPELNKKIERLRLAHRNQWFATNKPFGWEILDIRYGGVLARINTAISRIESFVTGKIDRIEELEEEKLHFRGPLKEGEPALVRFNTYTKMVSASPI